MLKLTQHSIIRERNSRVDGQIHALSTAEVAQNGPLAPDQDVVRFHVQVGNAQGVQVGQAGQGFAQVPLDSGQLDGPAGHQVEQVAAFQQRHDEDLGEGCDDALEGKEKSLSVGVDLKFCLV